MTKIFLAGCENEGHRNIVLECGGKHLLFSFLYFIERGMSVDEMERLFGRLKERGIEIFLDSGAHSFLSYKGIREGIVAERKKEIKFSPEEFVEIYIKYLKRIKNVVDWYVELDIDTVVGWEKVKEWRQRMWDEGLEPVLVWHRTIPDVGSEWVKWQEYPGKMVAIGDNPDIGRCVGLINQVKGKKVHGFALTKVDSIEKVNWYSVDSSSWLAGARFGKPFVFFGGKLIGCEKEDLKRYKEWIVKNGIEWEDVVKEKNDALVKVGALAFIQYNEYLQKKEENMKKVSPLMTEEALKKKEEKLKGNLNRFKTGEQSKLRGLVCDKCYAKEKCLNYEEGSICAVEKDFQKAIKIVGTRKLEDIKNWLETIWVENLKRLFINLHFEKEDGGVIDKRVSALINDIFSQAEVLSKIGVESKEPHNLVLELRQAITESGDIKEVIEVIKQEIKNKDEREDTKVVKTSE